MKTILAPIDFSPATKGVIAAAASLARPFDGRVVLLNVTQPPFIVADAGGLGLDLDDLTERTAKAALTQLEQIREQLERDFVKADVVQLTGLLVNLIIDQAKKLPADFIVMGSHGHTAIYDLLVGSTTSGVMKQSPCPVVIVPPPLKVASPQPARSRMNWQRIMAAPHL